LTRRSGEGADVTLKEPRNCAPPCETGRREWVAIFRGVKARGEFVSLLVEIADKRGRPYPALYERGVGH